MARMVELIRQGAAPTSMIRRAARGELSIPASEAIEILVTLAGDRELGEQAEQTLAGWEEKSLAEVASNPATTAEVLRYLLHNQAQRPVVVTALCGNPALALEELEEAAGQGMAVTLQAMMQNGRVRDSSRLLERMAANPAAEPARPLLAQWLGQAEGKEAEEVAANFMSRHAEEVAREDAQPFELVTDLDAEDDPLNQILRRVRQGETEVAPEEKEQLSLLQRIGRMRVGERIKLAVRGNREERMVLIRDRSKMVSLAVLESPKVNEGEMETFAGMKNVQETVLRAISTKKKYIKNYPVLRALVNNPKTPLDAALPLLAHLLVKDLRTLAMNKNVNDTVRKLAVKMFRNKTERKSD